MAENTLPEPKLRTEKYLNAIANNTAGGGGETAIIKKSKTIIANGTYSALNEDFDGYEQVIANVPNSFTPADEGKVVSNGGLVSQTSTNINTNGTVNTTTNNEVVVAVPNTYTAGDEGKVVSNGALVGQTATSITTNNTTVDTTLNNEVSVNITVPQPTLITKNIVLNGTYNASSDSADGYSSVDVQVPNTYAAADEGKVVNNGALVAQTAMANEITVNDTYDTTLYNSITVNVPTSSGIPLVDAFKLNLTIGADAYGATSYAYLVVYKAPGVSSYSSYIVGGFHSATRAVTHWQKVSTSLNGKQLSDYFSSNLSKTIWLYKGATKAQTVTYTINVTNGNITESAQVPSSYYDTSLQIFCQY